MGFRLKDRLVNAIHLDHTLTVWDDAIFDDDYYYEMVALYGFERFGIDMTVAQLGEMWKEYRAGTWGSSERRDWLLNAASPRPNAAALVTTGFSIPSGRSFLRTFTECSTPGMVNLAGATARQYSPHKRLRRRFGRLGVRGELHQRSVF